MRLIVCITGMPGSGKSTVAKALNSSFRILSMGDVVRREAERRGLEPSDVNLGAIMQELRKRYGLGAIAYLLVNEIKDGKDDIIIDGLRSIKEAEILKGYGNVKILAIHTPKDKRLKFLVDRNRSDAPTSKEEFEIRDKRELDVGVGEAIAYADAIITNDGSIEELQEKARKIIRKWKEEC
ncbi:MAG: AAA family ATPase [Candidatus Nitrosocaldaceae archaeon]